jgi:hypothetical protein
MNTCALSGQAAGTAAAWCAARNEGVGDIDEKSAEKLRQILLKEDMLLPGLANNDPDDLARKASAGASSFFEGDCGEPKSVFQVDEGSFLTIPRPAGGEVSALFSVSEDTELRAVWHVADIPSRYVPGKAAGELRLQIAKGEAQWINLPLPESEAGFLTLIFSGNSALTLHGEERQRTGFLCGHRESPSYGYPCVRGDYSALYRPEKAINGFNRPYLEPNLWISSRGDASPWIGLEWDRPQTLREVRLYFNPDLSREIPSSRADTWDENHKFAARTGQPPELVRAYSILLSDDGENWRKVFEEPENWRRMAVIRLENAQKASRMRIVFPDAGRAELFEIRVY